MSAFKSAYFIMSFGNGWHVKLVGFGKVWMFHKPFLRLFGEFLRLKPMKSCCLTANSLRDKKTSCFQQNNNNNNKTDFGFKQRQTSCSLSININLISYRLKNKHYDGRNKNTQSSNDLMSNETISQFFFKQTSSEDIFFSQHFPVVFTRCASTILC